MTGKTSATSLAPDGEALYELLFQNSLDGFMLTEPEGTILEANPAACRILGRTREEILREGRAGLIKRTGKAHGELRARRKDGTVFPIEISSVIFEKPAGQKKTCLLIRDISERKAADAERERLIKELQDALVR